MKSAALSRLLLIAGALLLSVLLFFAPKMPPAGKNAAAGPAPAMSSASDMSVFVRTAEKSLKPELLTKLQALQAAKSYDSLVGFWTRMRRPDLASLVSEQKAVATKAQADWMDAGNRYFYSTQFVQDKTEIPLLYQGAIRCYSRYLEKDPGNADVKIMLASCYVDGTADPMKGISMLREIEKTDSNNVKLQLTFAMMSAKSGQLDKAVQRFNKVLRLDSSYIEAYLHLADAYEQQGNKEGTLEMLEKYAARTNDVTARMEVEKYIRQLKETK